MSERDAKGLWLPGAVVSPETQFKKGTSGNPGGFHKTKRELRVAAREGLDVAIARARQILADDNAEWRAWIEAGKFLAPYGYGVPAKTEKDEDAIVSPTHGLTVEELRALARRELAMERERNDPGAKH